MAEGKVEAGNCYYVISHAYHHFLVEIVEMLGSKRARCRRIRKVHASQLNWTQFFADGCTRENTTLFDFPDGEVSWEATGCIFEWRHSIP